MEILGKITPNDHEELHMVNFMDLLQIIKNKRHKRVGDGATEAEIRHAEQVLGVTIQGDYRTFLRVLGWGGFECEIFGLGKSVPKSLDVVTQTNLERYHFQPHIPHYLLPIENDGWRRRASPIVPKRA